uniref:Uncharacterized protein n=1 Tax=Coccidioides posadasii RMSCC 3488 TaxID=454284 RepID=A0A0J6FEB2_COCPO|nr:hypothetical protein CPAG_07794 [Coccidioides posadasii RMSCC 3488]
MSREIGLTRMMVVMMSVMDCWQEEEGEGHRDTKQGYGRKSCGGEWRYGMVRYNAVFYRAVVSCNVPAHRPRAEKGGKNFVRRAFRDGALDGRATRSNFSLTHPDDRPESSQSSKLRGGFS